jgi:hypothetical protein
MAVRLLLDGLAVDEVGELLDALSPSCGNDLPLSARDIHDATSGIPLFVVELGKSRTRRATTSAWCPPKGPAAAAPRHKGRRSSSAWVFGQRTHVRELMKVAPSCSAERGGNLASTTGLSTCKMWLCSNRVSANEVERNADENG